MCAWIGTEKCKIEAAKIEGLGKWVSWGNVYNLRCIGLGFMQLASAVLDW